MRRFLRFGGPLANAVLILFAAGSVVIGALGLMEVGDSIAREKITATEDPSEIGVNLEPGQPYTT